MVFLVQLVTILVSVALASSSVVNSPVNNDGNFELVILHNNDMHARFEQTSQLSGMCTPQDREANKCYGGFPRVAHVVKEARKAAASGEGPPVLYLNAGDTYTGTAWFTMYKWKIAAEFINALKPDAVSFGNHEFDNGISGIVPFIENLTCPVLAANLILDKVPELSRLNNLRKSIVFNISNVQIGVIGYLTPETKILAIKNDVEYIDEMTALKQEIVSLKSQGVKIIIALGHSGYEKDQEIAKNVEGIDLVIGAHSHTFLWSGPSPDSEDPKGPYPTYVTQASGKRVPVVQAYAFTKYLGEIHMIFNSAGNIIHLDGRPLLLDNTIPQDPEVLSMLEGYRKLAQNISNAVVGNTSVILDNRNCDKGECNMGNLITDSMIYYYASNYNGEHWTDAPIAMLQAGGIRSSIAHSQLPTDITQGDLFTVMPFEGRLVTVAMNGTILLQMLEHSISRYGNSQVGEFLQFSGLKVTYDISKPVKSRVVSAVARCWSCDIPRYTEVEAKQIYRVIMPKFVSIGGDGFSMLKDLSAQILPYNELLCTTYYVSTHSPIFAELSDRIKIIDGNSHKDSSSILVPSLKILLFTIFYSTIL